MSVFYNVLMEKSASTKMRKMIGIINEADKYSPGKVKRAVNYVKGRVTDPEMHADIFGNGVAGNLYLDLLGGSGDMSRLRRARDAGGITDLPVPAVSGADLVRKEREALRESDVSIPRIKYYAERKKYVRGPEQLDWETRKERFKEERARLKAQPKPQPSPQPKPQPSPQPKPQPSPQPKPQPSPQPKPQPSPQPSPQQQSNLKRNLLLAGAGLTTAGGAGYLYHRNKKKRGEQR